MGLPGFSELQASWIDRYEHDYSFCCSSGNDAAAAGFCWYCMSFRIVAYVSYVFQDNSQLPPKMVGLVMKRK